MHALLYLATLGGVAWLAHTAGRAKAQRERTAVEGAPAPPALPPVFQGAVLPFPDGAGGMLFVTPRDRLWSRAVGYHAGRVLELARQLEQIQAA